MKDEFLLGLTAVQPEERTRILRFVYEGDVKRALIGRILIRKCVMEELNHLRAEEASPNLIRNEDIDLGRTAKGRPKLIFPACPKGFDFNVSHQGDFAVLAATSSLSINNKQSDEKNGGTNSESIQMPRVGVDVMKVETGRTKETAEFFRLMRRQLTDGEWNYVGQVDDELTKLSRFYRFWCLKESYVKALGVGIGFEVGRLHFHIKENLSASHPTSSSTVSVDDVPENGWTFEEMMLDDFHCVAVATRQESDSQVENYAENMLEANTSAGNGNSTLVTTEKGSITSITFFEVLTIGEVLKSFKVLNCDDEKDWESFQAKPEKILR